MWFGISVLATLFVIFFWKIINLLINNWLGSAEYSHGILLPFVSAFFIWQKKNQLTHFNYEGSWLGLTLLLAGILVFILGDLASLQILLEYAFLVVLIGGVWAVVGNPIFKIIWIPLVLLFFAIPLPSFLYQSLSAKLQLLSSELGVYFIRLWGISVYLEGNVIDLGAMQLQVAEACSGLTYLFPLTSVTFICAYLYRVAFWKRVFIFLSSIPITIFINSFRIGIIGVLVEYYGKSQAEGFLHDFEGWIVFMGGTAIIVAEMWLLTKVGDNPKPLREVFGFNYPEPCPVGTKFLDRQFPKQFWIANCLLVLAIALSLVIGQRQEIIPHRLEFAKFPMKIGDWKGARQVMDQQYIDSLKFEDYLLADYWKQGEPVPVNFYSAYYSSQRQGESIHSPRSCLPGGGWVIKSLDQISFYSIVNDRSPLKVNRALIQKGDERQLVYYWFRQRGRNITNEYLAKWYLFWDALTRNRTDGALIRIVTFVPKNEDIRITEKRLNDFIYVASLKLSQFIPD